MTTSDNFLKTVSENVNTRFKDPFFFSFCVSWLITNWRVWVYLFFEESNRFINVEEYFSRINNWYLLYIPLIAALLYTLLYPYVKWIFLLIRKKGLVEANEIEQMDVVIKKYRDLQIENNQLEQERLRIWEEREKIRKDFDEYRNKDKESIEGIKDNYYKLIYLISLYRNVIFSTLFHLNTKRTVNGVSEYLETNIKNLLTPTHLLIDKIFNGELNGEQIEKLITKVDMPEDLFNIVANYDSKMKKISASLSLD